jgi:O-antigen/teichoic acid export membrane protein
MLGTAAAQAIPIVISPILTRLYTPSDFAVLSVFLSVLNTLAIIITGRYELAIVLPRSSQAALSLVKIAFLISALLSGLFFLIFLFFGGAIAHALGNAGINGWLLLLPLPLFFTGLNQTLSYWLTRQQQYALISKGKLVQALSGAVLTLFFGFFPLVKGGLVIGNIIGVIASVIFTSIIVYPTIASGLWAKTRIKPKSYALKYSDFPKLNAVSTLINSLGIYIPLWYISSAFTAELTGCYGLGTRMIAIPLMLVSTSLAQVYFKKASDLFNTRGDVYGFTMKLFKTFLYISLGPLVIFILCAPWFFGLVFGARWYEAGKMAQYVAVGVYVQVIITPFTVIFAIINRLKVVMIWQVAYCAANVVIVFMNRWLFGNGLYTYLVLYTSMSVVLYGIYMLMIVRQLKKLSYA